MLIFGSLLFTSLLGNIKLEESVDVPINLKLVGNLEVRSEDIKFGKIVKGKGSYVRYGKLSISEGGGNVVSPIKVYFLSEDGTKQISMLNLTNGKDKIPVKLDLESQSKESYRIKALIENVSKDISVGDYTGIFKVRVVHSES